MRRVSILFLSLAFLLPLFSPCCRLQAQVTRTWQTLQQQGMVQYPSNTMYFLDSGKKKFQDLERRIPEAKHYIHVMYYKIWNDSIGNAFLENLARMVDRNVSVRVLYDAFGVSGKKPNVTPQFVQRWNERGIHLVGYDPMRFPYINHALHRDHRKMVIIDGRIVYTGGMNVADYYLHGRPEIGPWRDMSVCIEGDIVNGYEQLFAQQWYHETGEKLDSLSYHYRQREADLDSSITYPMLLVDRQPGSKSSAIRDQYIVALDNATRYVRIVNPYPIFVRSVRKAFYRALARGVKVEFLLSKTGDGFQSESSAAREMRQMARRGALVWLFQGAFHHDKIMIVDDTLCSVGTANLDARSLSFDYEVNPLILSPEYCRWLNQYFDREVSGSIQMTPESYLTIYSRPKRRTGWWLKGIRGIL